MEFMTAKDTAGKWGVTPRRVQQWCKDGAISGARRHGKSWMIPIDACKPEGSSEKESEELSTKSAGYFMPLTASAFPIGRCQAFIDSIVDEDERNIAQAEYYYFSGQAEKAASQAEIYLNHRNILLCLSACIIYGYANLSLGYIHAARCALGNIREVLKRQEGKPMDNETKAVCVYAGTMASVLLHLPVENMPSISDYTACLPDGLKLYACYLMSHYLYLKGDYGPSLGLAQAGIMMQSNTYSISTIYINIMSAINAMNLKRTEEAKKYFMNAWELARPDDLIECFGEHHGLLQGLIEVCLKSDYPKDYERVIEVTYRFSAGWRKIHNPDAKEEVADDLTTTEFTVAMLANRGWSNKEIAAHMQLSEHMIKYYISCTYQKLGISNRKQLRKYMLK